MAKIYKTLKARCFRYREFIGYVMISVSDPKLPFTIPTKGIVLQPNGNIDIHF